MGRWEVVPLSLSIIFLQRNGRFLSSDLQSFSTSSLSLGKLPNGVDTDRCAMDWWE